MLFSYFLSFGAVILLIMLIFSTFFLETFYTMTKSAQVEKNATKISKAIKENKNIHSTIEDVASYNSLSVYVYDSSSLFSLIYACEYDSPVTSLDFEYHDVYTYYKYAEKNGGNYLFVQDSQGDLVSKSRFITHNKSDKFIAPPSQKQNSENKPETIQNMVYADIIKIKNGSECFLLITSSITPLNNTVEIIRGQLYVVSIAFVILSILFSLYANKKIAKPISKTNTLSKELARKNYDVQFDASGYLEVEELNETLNYAKTELAATEKLQKELIANISHDLRTPLTMIAGYGEVMRDLPGENTPENIQIIIDESTRLTSLVNNLLDLSKLQSGANQPEKSRFCLTDSINDIFIRYAKLKEQDGYNLVFECKEKVYVYADELKISQVIYNLVNNAINYSGDDKTVIVSQSIKDRKVIVEVTDHGDGIPQDKLEYIWDRYYKVDKEHKRSVVGSGLGLSIAKSILDAHKARYGVRSIVGEGSTFWFELDVVAFEKNKGNAL